MHYEDRITLETPENVAVDVSLAGLGSRMIAILIDWVIRGGLILALMFLTVFLPRINGDPGAGGAAIFFVVSFLIFFGYDILFETLASGRTPGKRAVGIRVVRASGGPVGFVASSIRNLLRLIDMLPAGYAAGVIAILVSRRNQRLGDMAAGTLVIRDPQAADVPLPPRILDPETASWDVSTITVEEIGTVRRFLERRNSLDRQARARIADQLATRLHPKVGGAPQSIVAESFLEKLAAAKSARS
jgi:uncharacterized RDD family membrane protein YckC